MDARAGRGPQRFIVVGGGLGGALMAVYLGQAGHEVEVYERRSDPRRAKAAEGRSINLAISTRGLHALEKAGLKERILSLAIPMPGRMLHGVDGTLRFQPYGTRPEHTINSVSRAALNALLLDAAEALPTVKLHFGTRCTGVDLDAARATFQPPDGSAALSAQGDALLGTDGAFSVVRLQMQKTEGFDYQQAFLDHGYKELVIPAAEGGGFRMEKHALHIWPRGGAMLIALPNFDGSFTCTCFWPLQGRDSFASMRTPAEVADYFARQYPDAVPLMPTLLEDYADNPTGTLVTIRCEPWHHGDKVALLGDSCHAVVPFFGQGANAAFEDCVILDECLREHGADRQRAFAEYQRRRKVHTDALADLSLANFVEMRDKTASRLFLLEKRLEKALHRAFPSWFVPLYTLVTFSRTPYAEAVRRDRRQWRAVGLLAAALGALLLALLILGIRRWN
jgi:kynurenine 3-monooxygenase